MKFIVVEGHHTPVRALFLKERFVGQTMEKALDQNLSRFASVSNRILQEQDPHKPAIGGVFENYLTERKVPDEVIDVETVPNGIWQSASPGCIYVQSNLRELRARKPTEAAYLELKPKDVERYPDSLIILVYLKDLGYSIETETPDTLVCNWLICEPGHRDPYDIEVEPYLGRPFCIRHDQLRR